MYEIPILECPERGFRRFPGLSGAEATTYGKCIEHLFEDVYIHVAPNGRIYGVWVYPDHLYPILPPVEDCNTED